MYDKKHTLLPINQLLYLAQLNTMHILHLKFTTLQCCKRPANVVVGWEMETQALKCIAVEYEQSSINTVILGNCTCHMQWNKKQNSTLYWVIARVVARQILVLGKIHVKCYENWNFDDNWPFSYWFFIAFKTFETGVLRVWVQNWKLSARCQVGQPTMHCPTELQPW